MNLTIFFAVIAFIAVGWYIVSGIMIYSELQKRGQKVYFVFLNFMLPAIKKLHWEKPEKSARYFIIG